MSVILVFAGWFISLLMLGPELPVHNDEVNFLYESLRLPAEHRLGGYAHGPLLYEVIALVEVGWFGLLTVTDSVSSPIQFLTRVLLDQPVHLLMIRVIVALIALLLLVQIYRLGSLFGGRRVGGLACLLCATNLTFMILASSCKEDILFALLLVTAMVQAWQVARQPRAGLAVMTGITMGAAFVAKYFGVFAMALSAVPLLTAPRGGRGRTVALGVLMGLTACVSVLVLMPFIVTDSVTVLRSITGLHQGSASLPGGLALTDYLFVHLPNLIGWVILVAATVEGAIRLSREPRGPLVVMIAPFLLLFFLGLRSGLSRAYYIFPVAICMVVLASSLAIRVLDGMSGSPWRFLAPLVIGVVALFDPAFAPGSVKYALILTGPDTRLIARDYIQTHIPPGECIVMTHGVGGWNVWGPPLLMAEPFSGTGAFTSARRGALELTPGPRYQLKISNGFTGFDLDLTADCDWLVTARTSVPFSKEFGTPIDMDWDRPPNGFQVATVIAAVPEQQTAAWPFIGPEDYEEIRKISLQRLWRDRARGLTLVVYHRVSQNELDSSSLSRL